MSDEKNLTCSPPDSGGAPHSDELAKKIEGLLARCAASRVPQRRHTPIHGRGSLKVQAPSRLAGLDGSRGPGSQVRVKLGQAKAPKRRFSPGDRFRHDGSEWELLFMYRLARDPHVWLHCLAERIPNSSVRLIDAVVDALGGGETTERIVLTPFVHEGDASQYFGDIPRKGDSLIRTTQQLLAMQRVVQQAQLSAPGGDV